MGNKITIEQTNYFLILANQSGQRLDKFLAERLPEMSRSRIQKLIKEGKITVNDRKVLPHYRLRENDKINTIKAIEEAKKKLAPGDKKQNLSKYRIKVIAETPEYLVINKPAGLIIHGGEHIEEPTLADWLIKKYPKIKKVGEDPVRPGIVHRLDKDVSGLIVVARTQNFFNHLKKQFQKRKIEKKYTALVYGQIEKEEDKITFPIKRSRDGYKMAAVPATYQKAGPANLPAARQADTEFIVIKKFINYTLLKVKIKTGRPHQIRVHLTAYGHPIAGDDLYNTRKTRELNKKNKLGRIFLVADCLSFYDLAGKKQAFKINLPKELKEFLKKVK